MGIASRLQHLALLKGVQAALPQQGVALIRLESLKYRELA